MIPGLAAHAHAIGLIDRLATLFDSARRVAVPVVYVVDDRRSDGFGAADNIMVDRSIGGSRRSPGHGPIVTQLTPRADEIVIRREHGMTGFYTTPLDAYLRNLGARTV